MEGWRVDPGMGPLPIIIMCVRVAPGRWRRRNGPKKTRRPRAAGGSFPCLPPPLLPPWPAAELAHWIRARRRAR